MTEILATGEALRRLGPSLDRYLYAERTGRIPRAKLTSSGKRYFLPADISKLRRILRRERRQSRLKGAEFVSGVRG